MINKTNTGENKKNSTYRMVFDFIISHTKKIFRKIIRFDYYTKKYTKIANVFELPYIAYTNWGTHFADVKNYNNAIKKLETAKLMYGKNPKPCINLGIIYIKLKDYDKAIDVLFEAIKRDSQNPCAYSILSSAFIASGRFSEAEDCLKKALKLSPCDSEIYLNYGIFYAKMQNHLKAVEMFKKSKFFNPVNLHAVFLLGVMYYETSNINEAFAEFRKIEQINPEYKKLNYYIALCFQKEKNYSAVLEYAQKALDCEPDNPDIYILLAHSYICIKKPDSAIKIYESGEKRNLNSFDFLLSQGIVLSQYDDIKKAKNCIEKALAIKPADAEALYRMGVCFRKESNIEEAVNYYNKAIEFNPEHTDSLCDLAVIKFNNNDFNTSLQLFFKAISTTNEKKYLFFFIAQCFYKLGKLKKSIEFYEKTLEYYPEHLGALINLSINYLEVNNTKEALRKIRNAYQINRNSDKVIMLYSFIDLKCGILSDAIEKVDIILNKNPDKDCLKLLKAQILLQSKKAKAALNLLDSLPENFKTSQVYIAISYLAYKTLVEESPSDYNENMLNLYSEKINRIDSDILSKNWLISYINEE